VALGAAYWLHFTFEPVTRERGESVGGFPVRVTHTEKADWQTPVAIVLAIAGVGAGVAIALPGFRRP
jgi:hypothetical protein